MGTALHLHGDIRWGAGEGDRADELWVIDGRISWSPPMSSIPVQKISGWAIPGLVDAHCHVGLGAHGVVDDATAETQALTDRDRGTLLIRDAGSPADTRWMAEREDLPEIIRAGRHIARTKRYIRNYAHEIEPPELPDLMAAQARYGDGWVKIVGDWIDRGRGDLAPCWPDEAVAAGIAAAHAEGAKVTAHCFARESLEPLVRAGIDCIEHATGLTEDLLDLFVANNVAIVPTLVNIETFPDIAAPAREKFPDYYRHMHELYDARFATIGAAYEAGVAIYTGTDAGGSLAHGLIPDEVELLVRAGLPPVTAVGAASWDARKWLGRSGVEEGAVADLCVYAADPTVDVRVLQDPRTIILRGREVYRAG